MLSAFSVYGAPCTITVPAGGDIQAAIDAANPGDVICLVLGGTYTPAATIQVNKSITLTSSDPYSVTKPIIDGSGTLPQIIHIKADDVIIDGLEIRNGTADLVKSHETDLDPAVARITIRNCNIHNSTGDEAVQLKYCTDCLIECIIAHDIRQDGICMAYSTRGTISNCEVYNSNSDNAAIYVYNSYDMNVECNYIHDNTASNGIFLYKNYGTSHTVANNLVVNNIWDGKKRNYDEADGNTINIYKPQVTSTYVIQHNTLDNNTGEDSSNNPTGNAIYLNDYDQKGFSTNIVDNIITNHNGYGIRTKFWTYGAIANYDYNDLWQNADGATDGNPVDGGHNISADPLYNVDYSLQSGSPCKGTASDSKDMGVLFNECSKCEPPTLIVLSSFTATPSNKKAIIEWVTETEIDNAGFNLHRAESEDGEYVKINGSLIPAEGNGTSGASYQYIDNDVKNRTTYYYKLEDIDLSGNSTMHGPVSAMLRRVRSAK